MSKTATATLQTPWDCRWSRFGRVHASEAAPAEALWVCVYPEGTRRSIDVAECESCSHFEYESPFFVPSERRAATFVPSRRRAATAIEHEASCAACSPPTRAEKRLEMGARLAALLLAAIFAAIGFVVLTRPLAVPLTVTLWLGAAISFMLGIWGPFNRRSLPERSW